MKTTLLLPFTLLPTLAAAGCNSIPESPETGCAPGAVVYCAYSGAPETEGVGACRAGRRVCEPDGSAYGPCQGEVLPLPETCATSVDDDCNGQVNEAGVDCACTPGDLANCYDGPADTDGVGACHGGVQACKSDGSGFGECLGQVLPVAESCYSGADDDCDGLVNEDGAGCTCMPGTLANCYAGPPGTEGVGICHVGVQVCNAQGTGYGACLDESLPKSEDCATALDDDCDGVPNQGCACIPNEVVSCYSGSVATAGVGVCHSGVQVCDPSGMGFGACTGEILPTFETCETAADEDCDGNAHCNGQHLWSLRFGDSSPQEGRGAAVDSKGNIVIGGFGQGVMDFGTGPWNAVSSYDAYIAKFDGNGAPLWSKFFGDTQTQYILSIAVDPNDNIVATGYFQGTVDFGGGPLTAVASYDSFVVKFDANGNHLWSKQLPGSGNERARAVATDMNGNIAVVGYFDADIDFGAGKVSTAGSNDIFVLDLKPDGSYAWGKVFGDSGTLQHAQSVAFAPNNGDVVVGGYFDGTVNFGGGALATAGGRDIFVARFSSQGSHVWSKRYGDASSYQRAWSVATDSLGDVLVTGDMEGTVDFGGGGLTSAGGGDIFLTKLSGATGAHLWSQRFGDVSDSQVGSSLAVDGANNVVLGAYFQGSVDFGPGLLTASGYDGTVAKLDSNGKVLWSKQFYGLGHGYVDHVATNSLGQVFAVGEQNHHGGLRRGNPRRSGWLRHLRREARALEDSRTIERPVRRELASSVAAELCAHQRICDGA